MAACSQCGVKVVFPYQCKYCSAYFCPDHRLPENHACSRLTKRNRPEVRVHTLTPPKTPLISGSKKFSSIVRLLKKKIVIVLLVFLVMTSIWIAIYSNSSLTVRQAYQQFLIFASLAFIFPFVLGFTLVVMPKRRWVTVGRTVTKTRGRWGGMSGGEESVSIAQTPEERKPLYKSKRFIKWSLIIGGILALFGFSCGIIWPEICFVSIILGSAPLGWGIALVKTGGRY